MFKKILLIATLCISLMALMGTSANAFPPRWGGTSWAPGSVDSELTVRGCANTDNRPTRVHVTLNISDVLILYRNPGHNRGGVGVPFRHPYSSSADGEILSPLHGRGKCIELVSFESATLLADLCAEIDCDALAPNPQWEAVDINIEVFEGIIELYTDLNDLCEDETPPNAQSCLDPDPLPPVENDWEEVIHVIYDEVRLQYDKKGRPESYDWDPDDVHVWEYSNNVQYYDEH